MLLGSGELGKEVVQLNGGPLRGVPVTVYDLREAGPEAQPSLNFVEA